MSSDNIYLFKKCNELIQTPAGRKIFGLSNAGKILKAELLVYYGNDKFRSDKERFFAAARGLSTRPSCKTCDAETSLFNYDVGFSEFCSRACSWAHNDTLTKRKETSIQKFGKEHHSQTDAWKSKNSKTMKDNSRNIQSKRKATLEKKHGDLSLAYADIWVKARQTMNTKYGADNISSVSSESVKTRSKRYLEKLPSIVQSLEIEYEVKALWDTAQYNSIPKGEYEWRHLCGHTFKSHFSFAGIRPRCPACRPKSMVEQTVSEWLQEAEVEFIKNDRKIIKPLELDFLIQDLAVEVNGWYWHQDDIGRTSLKTKTDLAKKENIRLIHFWDWEIENTPMVCKSVLLNALGKSKRIYGRKCDVRKIEKNVAKEFCESHHIAGSTTFSSSYGIFSQDEMIGVATFGTPRFSKKAEWEIVRLCYLPFTSVHGGLSKFLKAFRKEHPSSSLISYSDNRFFTGISYEKAGFKLISENQPSYIWKKGNMNLSRFKTQKHKLSDLLGDNFDSSKSESENMKANKWAKLSDCGTKTWLISW